MHSVVASSTLMAILSRVPRYQCGKSGTALDDRGEFVRVEDVERLAKLHDVRRPLTPKQLILLTFLRDFIEVHGYAPSFAEIASSFGYRSLATVHEHISTLEYKGYIARHFNESRSIIVLTDEEMNDA